ncbi:16298_t:CDS:1, partial [Funneliformis geosporum]
YESQIDLNNDIEVKIEPGVETEDKSFNDLDLQAENDSDDILSPTKIETYRKIYMKEPIENEEDETETNKKKLKKDLDIQDDQSYLHKLITMKCCKANCFNTK